jgi:negative regulator of sigma E activity
VLPPHCVQDIENQEDSMMEDSPKKKSEAKQELASLEWEPWLSRVDPVATTRSTCAAVCLCVLPVPNEDVVHALSYSLQLLLLTNTYLNHVEIRQTKPREQTAQHASSSAAPAAADAPQRNSQDVVHWDRGGDPDA